MRSIEQSQNVKQEKSEAVKTERLFAVGDLHADLQASKNVLRLIGIIDDQDRWMAKNTILVQTGDLTDRGPDGKNMLDFFRQLEKQAPQHNSQFITLIGNHEAMNIMGDWRYVSLGDVQSFGGKEERIRAFSENGEWRDWILTHNLTVKIQDTVFVHGGITKEYAKLGIDAINQKAKEALRKNTKTPILGSDGPLWFRGYLKDEKNACEDLQEALRLLDAKRMVVGHTTQRSGKIASRCNGSLIGIDTGISKHYGSHISVLDLSENDAKAIYLNETQDLPDPIE